MRYVAGDPALPVFGRHAAGGRRDDPRGGDRDGGRASRGGDPSRPEAVEHRRDARRAARSSSTSGWPSRRMNPVRDRLSGRCSLGTPDYASPEQLRGDAGESVPRATSSRWASSCMSGWRGDCPSSVPATVPSPTRTTPPAPPSTYRVEVDPALDAICLKALAREPGDRYPSMAAWPPTSYAYLERDLGPAPARRPRAGRGLLGVGPRSAATSSGSSSSAPAHRRRRTARRRTGCSWTSATTSGRA